MVEGLLVIGRGRPSGGGEVWGIKNLVLDGCVGGFQVALNVPDGPGRGVGRLAWGPRTVEKDCASRGK